MKKHLYHTIIKPICLFLITLMVTGCFSGKILSFSGKPHPKQYLVCRNYISGLGLNSTVDILDLKGEQIIKAIHIGTPEQTKVQNYIKFNENGEIVSISKQKKDSSILKLVDFRYDRQSKLSSIIPNKRHFIMLDYDSIKIEYKGAKPAIATAVKKEIPVWTEYINFDDDKGHYSFTKKINNKELYNIYNFEGNKLIAEYHRTRITDNNIDSIRYSYNDSILVARDGIYSSFSKFHTTYDEFGRPYKNTYKEVTTDSIMWEDEYFYSPGDKIPNKITTTSPMGWEEEIEFYWE